MKIGSILCGLGFCAVAIGGGLITGLVTHQVALLVAGIGFAAIGIIGLVSDATFTVTSEDNQVVFWSSMSSRPALIVVCVVLVLAAGASFFIWPPMNGPYW